MKKTTRARLPSADLIETREEMETLVGEIAALKIEEASTKAEMDARLQAVREQYESRLGDLAATVTGKMAIAKAWADTHPEEFGRRKSIEFMHGTAGYRTGTPKLKTLAGWTFERVLAAVKLSPTLRELYVRVKEELAKDKLIDAHPHAMTDDALRKIGLRVAQDEVFFVDPNMTETSARAVAPTPARAA